MRSIMRRQWENILNEHLDRSAALSAEEQATRRATQLFIITVIEEGVENQGLNQLSRADWAKSTWGLKGLGKAL